jgi:hypothetical protein
MFERTGRALRLTVPVLGSSALLAVAVPLAASADEPGAIVLQPEWDVYQRPSGSQDSPLGFHVKLDDGKSTATEFSGTAHTLSMYGLLEHGSIHGTAITFTVTWPDGKIGRYDGNWFQDGYLRGHTIRPAHPADNAEWWSGDNSWRT